MVLLATRTWIRHRGCGAIHGGYGMEMALAARLARKVVARSVTERVYLGTGINVTKPNDIRATLTERCNYRCQYCDHWRQDRYSAEMTLNEWRHALASIRDYVGRYAVQFLGGEPMIVPWFFDLVRFCRESAIDWGVITNGSTLTAANVERIVAARPMNVDVSLDSLVGPVNDRVRGATRGMERVVDGVTRLVDARHRAGVDFVIRIKPTMTKATVSHVGAIVDWAATMPGVFVDVSPVRLWKAAEIEALYPAGPDEIAALRREIAALVARKQKGAPIETSLAKLNAIVAHFTGNEAQHGVAKCRSGLRSVNVRPDGSVEHCFAFTNVGNLRTQTMREIWECEARRGIVDATLGCDLFKTTCSTSCMAHRSFGQDVRRGLALMRIGA